MNLPPFFVFEQLKGANAQIHMLKKYDFSMKLTCLEAIPIRYLEAFKTKLDLRSTIARIHTESRKCTFFEAICLLEACKTMRENNEICENP